MSASIDISATDNASATIDGVAGSLQNLQGSADSTTGSTASFSDTLSASTRVGSTAMIALDRIQISMDAVANASNRQELAQMRVNDAVTRFGAGSEQAQKANIELENSTRSLEIAQEREQVRMTYGMLVVIPGMVRGLKDLVTSLQVVDEETGVATLSIEAMTAAQLANIAVATLGVGVPIALMAMTFAEQQANQQMNVYGNVNVNGVSPSSLQGVASTAQAAVGNP